MNISEVMSVVVTGMVVVFLALIILIVVVSLFGKIFTKLDNAKKNKNNSAAEVKPQTPAANASVVQAVSAAEETDGVSGSIVAAITAAIACVLASEGEAKPFVVKSIKRVKDSRNVWNMAGIMENTKPF